MELRLVECYWTDCCDEVVVKWHPSKDPKHFLFVCKRHFDVISKMFEYKMIDGEHYSIASKV